MFKKIFEKMKKKMKRWIDDSIGSQCIECIENTLRCSEMNVAKFTNQNNYITNH